MDKDCTTCRFAGPDKSIIEVGKENARDFMLPRQTKKLLDQILANQIVLAQVHLFSHKNPMCTNAQIIQELERLIVTSDKLYTESKELD